VLDLMGKHSGGEGGDDDNKKEGQGLSIEEIPAATIRETLLQQKNRYIIQTSFVFYRIKNTNFLLQCQFSFIQFIPGWMC